MSEASGTRLIHFEPQEPSALSEMGDGMVDISKVRDYIVHNFLFGDSSELDDSTSFYDGRILDSTGLLSLVLFIEKEYDVTIADEEVTPDNLDSIERIRNFLMSKLPQTVAT